jgi:predicted RNA binding protein YcfA (HicA-like mRNA interferase family)
MSKPPVVSETAAAKALNRIGYEIDHQTASHLILPHSAPPHRRLTVPNHKELAKGTLRSIIRDAGLTVDQFADLL